MKIKSDWWKSAFGKNYIIASNPLFPEQTEKEMIFLKKIISDKKNFSVLDAACGYGRHSIELARLGVKVTGVDYSDEFIFMAKEQAKKMGLQIDYFCRDVTKIDFANKFNMVLLIGNSLGYGSDSDNEQLIQKLSYRLKRGGVFVLGTTNALKFHVFKDCKEKGSIHFKKKLKNDRYELQEKYEFNPITFYLSQHWMVNRNGKKIYELSSRVRIYTLPEISNLFSRYGLVIRHIFGSYNGEPFGISSPQCIIVAYKKTAI